MQISKGRLTYNLVIIAAALILFFFTYPSNIANIALVIITIGVLVTLDNMFPMKRKKSKYLFIFITVLTFTVVFYFTSMA